jgi:hypothetical protein
MGRACRTDVRDEKCLPHFGQKKPRRRHHLGNLGVGGKIILKWISN